MSDLSHLSIKIAELLHEDKTYHIIMKSLCEKEEQGFNELFNNTGNLRRKTYPDKGTLSKNTYYDYIEALLKRGIISRRNDPTHSQRWLYQIEPQLKDKLKNLYQDLESYGYHSSIESAEQFFKSLEPSQAAQRLEECAVANLMRAYIYCVENPSLAEYRLSLTMQNLETLGLAFTKIGSQSDNRSAYVSALEEVRLKWLRFQEGGTQVGQ
jgi:DNA-binding HxlR family transcriptional regulator